MDLKRWSRTDVAKAVRTRDALEIEVAHEVLDRAGIPRNAGPGCHPYTLASRIYKFAFFLGVDITENGVIKVSDLAPCGRTSEQIDALCRLRDSDPEAAARVAAGITEQS